MPSNISVQRMNCYVEGDVHICKHSTFYQTSLINIQMDLELIYYPQNIHISSKGRMKRLLAYASFGDRFHAMIIITALTS